ncbi:phospho-2-dehydro-3-deoxyheptonate aldolase [Leptospira kobayashii]|uniref:Phospho-2-dehydro-3-deoxyheptonate aldolase n=1 Tax=Leptospira kobayashii TaxID=1917830 RepID=A0ABN6K9T7_9LEPT|nr:3-deoxy-7-phosphoheptulonate synthase [Leptospira kobayashii]BDA77290.1 phospho-2-dehydro-3-deoxyheptonate aldolase [Leptospira kobayashii]
MKKTDNLRILEEHSLIPASVIMEELPLTDRAAEVVTKARKEISDLIHGRDNKRLLVVVGPCSVHDTAAVMEYAGLLRPMIEKFKEELVIVMRVYFEKPRTTVGWKGLINDPNLDGSFHINKGLQTARKLLLDLNNLGIPCGTEFLDVISPQYVADLVSWGAIGARTTESQVHRELASGLSAPIGFKNGTDGNVQIAIDALRSAGSSHHFLSVTNQGSSAIFKTAGNPDTHVILRGGNKGPNYDEQSIGELGAQIEKSNLPARVMIDCSHGNSQKDYRRQPIVLESVGNQFAAGSKYILGVMVESHLKEGNQSIDAKPLVYGQSITDACVSWETTVPMLEKLAESVRKRKI